MTGGAKIYVTNFQYRFQRIGGGGVARNMKSAAAFGGHLFYDLFIHGFWAGSVVEGPSAPAPYHLQNYLALIQGKGVVALLARRLHKFSAHRFVSVFPVKSMEAPCSTRSFPLDHQSYDEYDPGDTTLITAAYNGHVGCVNAWLDAGADVNTGNNRNETPLIHAAKRGHTECAEVLINAGADVNLANAHRMTALMAASELGSETCVELLTRSGADPNYTTESGHSALMDSILNCHEGCADILINVGANVNAATDIGHTAIMFAAYENLQM